MKNGKRLNKDYLFEVWVFTLTLTPVYLYVFSFLFPSIERPDNLILMWFILFFTGAYLSVPTLIINLLVYRFLSNRLNLPLLIKFLHVILSIGLISGTYLILPQESLLNPGEQMGIYILSVAAAVITASSLFRVFRRNFNYS